MFNELRSFLTNGWKEEKWFILAGGFGGILAIICLVLIGLFGSVVPPEGDLSKAFSFNAALGMFMVSTAYILYVTNLSIKEKSLFRKIYMTLIVLSYGIETIQHARGFDPRFSREGTLIDTLIGIGFGVISLGLLFGYLWLISAIWKKGIRIRVLIATLSIRYTLCSLGIAFLFGLIMVIIQNEFVRESGSIIWVHGLGFHGLQVLPIVAWILHHSRVSDVTKLRLIHMSGLSWLFALLLLFFQAIHGYRLLEHSVWLYLIVSCIALSIVPGLLFIRGGIKTNIN